MTEIQQGVKELAVKMETDPVGTIRAIRDEEAGHLSKKAEAIASGIAEAAEIKGVGEALKTLLKRAARKLPAGIGLAVTGASVAGELDKANEALEDGILTPTQHEAVLYSYAGAGVCSASASVPVLGTAASFSCEEAVEKLAEEAGVPKDFRPGTTSEALRDVFDALKPIPQLLGEKWEELTGSKDDEWRKLEAKLAENNPDNARELTGALRELEKTDPKGAQALKDSAMKEPEKALNNIYAYTLARDVLGGERFASSAVDPGTFTPSPVVTQGNDSARTAGI